MGKNLINMNIEIIKNKNISDYKLWQIWKCKPSEFDWEYIDEEHCYIIKGVAIVTTSNGPIKIKADDYVIFPKGLKCHWEVLQSIKKYYSFKEL